MQSRTLVFSDYRPQWNTLSDIISHFKKYTEQNIIGIEMISPLFVNSTTLNEIINTL